MTTHRKLFMMAGVLLLLAAPVSIAGSIANKYLNRSERTKVTGTPDAIPGFSPLMSSFLLPF